MSAAARTTRGIGHNAPDTPHSGPGMKSQRHQDRHDEWQAYVRGAGVLFGD